MLKSHLNSQLDEHDYILGLVPFKPAKQYRTHLTDQLENFIKQCYILVEQPGKKLFVYSFFSAQNPASRHLRREFILGI
jgi:hypothetical protein